MSLYKRLAYIIILHVCYKHADFIIHVSEFALKEQKFFRNKADFVYHGVHKFFCKKNGICYPIKFLYVGRIEKSKGVDIIVGAFKSISNNLAELHIVGDGSYARKIKQTVRENIYYYGFREDVEKFYNKCDVLITLPKNEAFGLTIIEAMSYSLPVIASSKGAIPEIVVNGETGFIVKRNVHSLIKAIKQYIQNTDLVKTMGRKAYEGSMSGFNISQTVAKILKILSSVLQEDKTI